MDNDTSPEQARVSAALEEAEVICSRKGRRLTQTRREVLRMLLENRSPSKAYDLLTALGHKGSSGPPTIYRALKFLVNAGLVHRIESLNSYFVCGHWLRSHVAIFLICNNCEEAQEIYSPETVSCLDTSAKRENFVMRKSVIETYGECRRCAGSVD